jgi:hypothetical protein
MVFNRRWKYRVCGHRVQWDQLLIIVRLGGLNDTGLLAHLLGLTLDRLEMDPALAGGALEICANGTPQAVNVERDSAAILLLAHSFRNVFVQPVIFRPSNRDTDRLASTGTGSCGVSWEPMLSNPSGSLSETDAGQ